MDCRTVRLLVDYFRAHGDELEPSETRAFHSHLGSCEDCRRYSEGESHLDLHIGRAVRAVPIPIGLRERLLETLATQRKQFYRRWLGRGVAAAAVILLSLGIYFGLREAERSLAIGPKPVPQTVPGVNPAPKT